LTGRLPLQLTIAVDIPSLSGGVQFWIPPEREVFQCDGIFEYNRTRPEIT
jgi:hypothetical protein